MRIALVTTGRFWLVDLARELAARGHEPLVYSIVPPARTRQFGLPKRCNRWLGKYVAPAYGATLVFKKGAPGKLAQRALLAAVDVAAAAVLEPCDVLVGMSGIAHRTLNVARRKYGATIFLERANSHILTQREILEAVGPKRDRVSDWTVKRELAGYQLADVITVPSQHVKQSFIERGFPEEKLFLNPFGVETEGFKATPAPGGKPTVVMTGTWSLRKGCDTLTEAWRRLPGTRLLHVGPIAGDVPLPESEDFVHWDAVPQAKLQEFYAQGHVFALASREEGLALVQVQAIAAGLPLVCTEKTGGADLKRNVKDPNCITVTPVDDAPAFARALQTALDRRAPEGELRDLLVDRNDVSWAAYAARYEAEMLARTEVVPSPCEL